MNKVSVNETSIPNDIGNTNYKILISELNFDNTVSKNVEKVHNNSAESYFQKNFKGNGLFIPEADLKSSKYSDTKVYRYVLMNKITKKLEKTSGGITSTSYISSFYFIDRETDKSSAYIGESTTALWMFKAIIDKINTYFK